MSNTVTICICTFRNPSGLQSLLQGLDQQLLDTVEDSGLTVAVVDNDADGSAGDTLDAYAAHGRFKLLREVQSARGLSNARNSALRLAFASQSDLFAFLDDDEVPSANWVERLVECFSDANANVVVGPVEPRFEVLPPQWISTGDFFHKRCPDSGELHQGYTSNVMMRTRAIAATEVRFDVTLNSIGGEDVVFFRELHGRGMQVRCAPQAVVYEFIPRGRASLKWMMRRWLRSGATSALLAKGANVGLRVRLANAARGLGRIVAGSMLVLLKAITRGRRDFGSVALSIATVCRGAGMFLAAFGISYREYGNSYRRNMKRTTAGDH
jgi:succinoglycan biosynthesis protein ExoM